MRYGRACFGETTEIVTPPFGAQRAIDEDHYSVLYSGLGPQGGHGLLLYLTRADVTAILAAMDTADVGVAERVAHWTMTGQSRTKASSLARSG